MEQCVSRHDIDRLDANQLKKIIRTGNEMIKISKSPTVIPAQGIKPKMIEEFIGRVSSQTTAVSIARMKSPEGWEEPGQKPEFDEYSLVLRGTLKIETNEDTYDIMEGEAVIVPRNEWVRYSTPYAGGAEYISVCLPAFSPHTVHRNR